MEYQPGDKFARAVIDHGLRVKQQFKVDMGHAMARGDRHFFLRQLRKVLDGSPSIDVDEAVDLALGRTRMNANLRMAVIGAEKHPLAGLRVEKIQQSWGIETRVYPPEGDRVVIIQDKKIQGMVHRHFETRPLLVSFWREGKK